MSDLKTIAKMADVSPATVSLALRDDPRVAGKTKELIAKLAKEVGQIMNEFVRNERISVAFRMMNMHGQALKG